MRTQPAIPAWRLATLAAGLSPALAAPAYARDDDTQALLRKMNERLEQLEKRNQTLEQEVKVLRQTAAAPAPASVQSAADAARIEKLEQQVKELAAAPHEDKPEEEGGSGIEIGGSLVAIYQHVNDKGSDTGDRESRVNYRGDIEVSLPVAGIGDAQGKAFAHVRFGQGEGIGLRPTHVGVPNSLAFETGAGHDDSFAILAQAWYQLTWPLKAGGFNDQPGDRVELTIGKMDFFGFFDQNDAAGDEASQFLNNAFVHNALLDTGGDIAADAYGFAPGVRLAYVNEGDGSYSWRASLGMFGSGDGANFSDKVTTDPLTIAQLEYTTKQINGEARGNYRVYAWTNGNTQDLVGTEQRHSGWGLSVDQKLWRDWSLFGRYGKRTSGDGLFDSALTGGFQLGGAAWSRRNDAIGLGLGRLKTGDEQRVASGVGGKEKLVELYYRAKLNEQLELSPHVQYIRDPAGDGSAPSVKIFGMRAGLSF